MKRTWILTLSTLLFLGCAARDPKIRSTVSPELELPANPRIAVLPMELAGYGDGDIEVIRQNWRNMVESGLLQNSFRVVDRDVVDSILSEQHFQRSGIVSKTSSVKVGEILGINLVLMGTVRVLAADGSQFHIQLRVVDVQSAELLANTFATGGPGIGFEATNNLALKLKERFVLPTNPPPTLSKE